MRRDHALRDGDTNEVTAAVAGAAHSISMTALLPPATGEATRRSLLRAVAVAAHAALLVIAARVHLDVVFLGDCCRSVGCRCRYFFQLTGFDGIRLRARL